MSEEQAKLFDIEIEVEGIQPRPCSRCGRMLTEEKHIKIGMGPVCFKKFQKELQDMQQEVMTFE